MIGQDGLEELPPVFQLFNGDGLGEVSWLVYVAAAADGDVVGQQLEGDDFNERGKQLDGGGCG
jgi:hypothetical protein